MKKSTQNISFSYHPFGWTMPGRSFKSVAYKYGFNGMEKADEIADTEGQGANYTTPFRMLDTRLGGRWWSIDPIVKPWESSYAGFSNNPIYFSDPSGLDPDGPGGKKHHVPKGVSPKVKVGNSKRIKPPKDVKAEKSEGGDNEKDAASAPEVDKPDDNVYAGSSIETITVVRKSPTVCSRTPTNEKEQNDFYGSMKSYRKDYNFPDDWSDEYIRDYWDAQYGGTGKWDEELARISQEARDIEVLFKLSWFTMAFTYSGGFAFGAGGLGATPAPSASNIFNGSYRVIKLSNDSDIIGRAFLTSGKAMNGDLLVWGSTMLTHSQRSMLAESQYFVTTRGTQYWMQPGHLKMSITDNSWLIRNASYKWVYKKGGSYFFENQGINKFGFGYNKSQLGVRPDGGIYHSTSYPLK